MDDKDQDLGFTLEDILREFGSHQSEPEQKPEADEESEVPPQESGPLPEEDLPEAELPEEEPEEDLPADDVPPLSYGDEVPDDGDTSETVYDGISEEAAYAAAETCPSEDASDPLSDPVTEEDTIRLDPETIAAEASRTGTQEDEPAEPSDIPDPASQIPEGAEPFSSSWEPEYEQPIGEYTPPEPIVFRPRSQLQSLKRKLVAGPERRYYAIAESGPGRLQISIFLSLLVVVLGVASILMHHFGLVQPDRMRLLVFSELFAMLFSALLASNRLLEGLLSLFKGKFTLDTLLLATFGVCMVDGYFSLQEVRVPFCAAFCLEVTMSLWADYQRRSTEMGQMDTLRKAIRLNRVAKAPDCYDDRPGFYVTDGELEDFMDTYQQPTGAQKLVNAYALTAFLASAVIAVVIGLSRGISAAMQVWSAGLLAASPVTIFICQSRPMAILERRLHKLGTVLCGPEGIKAVTGAAAVPLSDSDLFPSGSMKINGVKFYTAREPDQVIAYAAALIESSGSCLSPLFQQLLEDRNGRRYDTDQFREYANGGLGGEVCQESVLMGTIEFLQEMGVETPEGSRVNQAVYMAIDGELCAVFALAFGKLRGVSAGLGTLCGYRGLTPVLTSNNFLLSEGFIRAKFGVNTRRLAFPTPQERRKAAAWVPDVQRSTTCALTTQDSLASFSFAITGGRALYTSTTLGAIVHILGGILGLLIVLVLTVVHGDNLLTPTNLLLFELVWSIPGLLITEWTRNI